MTSRARPAASAFAPAAFVAALIALVLLSSPVRAANAPDAPLDAAAETVLPDLFLEIALLSQLQAFDAPMGELRPVDDHFAPYAGIPREALQNLLTETDARLAATTTSLDPGLLTVAAQPALSVLTQDQRARIADGDTEILSPIPYRTAVEQFTGGGFQATIDALKSAGNRDAVQSLRTDGPTGPQLQASEGPGAGEGADGQRTFFLGVTGLIVIVAACLVVGGALTALWLHRRRAGLADPVTAEIFDAHRRLAQAVDEQDVADIGSATAAQITDATDAFVFREVTDGLRRVGSNDVIVHSVLTRVVETGQPLLITVGDDPAVSTASICVVPLISDGHVGGVLVARRATDRPFDNEDRNRLELLAPALAGALSSADQFDSYEHLAMKDGLTALGNRRRLDGDLEATLSEAVENNLPVGFAMIDVDNFKDYNDAHGHEAGDRALQAVARLIESAVRARDVVYRYGGEEFSVLLPGATREEARSAAERIRQAVERAPFEGEASQPGGHLTVSVGVATLEGGAAATLKARADEALYGAKADGRNRIHVG